MITLNCRPKMCPVAFDLEKHLVRVLGQLETLSLVRGVEVAELVFPFRQVFPLHETVVHDVVRRVVAQHDPSRFFEGHGEVTVVAPWSALDELRREIHTSATATVAKEISQRTHYGRRLRTVEVDLQDHAPRGKLLVLVPRNMQVANDARSLQVGHGHSAVSVQRRQLRIPVIFPAGVGEARANLRLDLRHVERLCAGTGSQRAKYEGRSCIQNGKEASHRT